MNRIIISKNVADVEKISLSYISAGWIMIRNVSLGLGGYSEIVLRKGSKLITVRLASFATYSRRLSWDNKHKFIY